MLLERKALFVHAPVDDYLWKPAAVVLERIPKLLVNIKHGLVDDEMRVDDERRVDDEMRARIS